MLPLARNTISRTTSPSIFNLRPSAVYSGRGFSRISTGVGAPSPLAAFFFGASAATVWSPKPLVCTVPRFPPLGGGIAVPLPNPVLATVPRIPLSPPVPLPYPGPPGKAGEPRRFTLVALFGSPLPERGREGGQSWVGQRGASDRGCPPSRPLSGASADSSAYPLSLD